MDLLTWGVTVADEILSVADVPLLDDSGDCGDGDGFVVLSVGSTSLLTTGAGEEALLFLGVSTLLEKPGGGDISLRGSLGVEETGPVSDVSFFSIG